MAGVPATDERTIAPLTAVVGDEEFLVERAILAVISQVRAAGGDVEVRELRAADLQPGRLLELTSPSLFGGPTAVVVRDAELLGKDDATSLGEELHRLPDDATVIVVHKGGARGKAALDAALAAGARRIDCARVTRPGERIDFVRAEFRRLGRSVSEDAVRVLVDAVGSDLRELAAACGQLCSDVSGRLDARIVARYHRGRAEASGFAVADRALEGRLSDALEQLRWALAVGTAPVLITSALAQGLRALAKVASASRGLRGADLARELGMPSWKIDRVRAQLPGWTPDGVAGAIRAVAQADAQVKGGATDPAYALERAVMAIVTAKAAG